MPNRKMHKVCTGDQLTTLPQNNLALFLQNFALYLKERKLKEQKYPSNALNSCDCGDNLNLNNCNIYNYRRNINNRLKEINNNVSHIITDSCSRIDELCNKVRACLNEMTYIKESTSDLSRKQSIEQCFLNPYHIKGANSSADDVSVHDLEEVKFENTKSLTICDYDPSTYSITEISQSRRSINDLNNRVLQVVGQSSDIITSFENTILDEVYSTERMNNIIEAIQMDIERLSETASKVVNRKKVVRPPPKEELKRKLTDSLNKPYIVPLPEDSDSRRYLGNKSSLECGIVPSYFNQEINLVPDVYRRPAITNIFQKLLVQLEANDSFICFQKLMQNCEKQRNKIVPMKAKKGTSKIHLKKKKSKSVEKLKKLQVKPKNIVTDIPFTKSFFTESKSKSGSSRTSSRKSFEVLPTKRELKRKYKGSLWFLSSNHKISKTRKVKKVSIHPNSLPGIDKYGLKSFSSKNVITNEPELLKNQKCIEKKSISTTSFKNRTKDVLQTKSLCFKKHVPTLQVRNDIPITLSEKLRLRWLCFKNVSIPARKLKCLNILDDLTAKDLHPLKSAYPRKDEVPKPANYLHRLIEQGAESIWDQLLQPTINCSKKDCQICNSQENQHEHLITIKEKREENIDAGEMGNKTDIIKKLRPYIFDSQYRNEQTYTVLPVQVYYDRLPNKNKEVLKTYPQNNSFFNMKETTNLTNKGKWTSSNSPKDESVNEKPLTMLKLPPSSIKKQLILKSKEERSIAPITKRQPSKEIASSSSTLHPTNKKDTFSRLQPKCENNLQNLKSVEKKVEKEIEQQAKGGIYKNASNSDKKMWSRRYGKSVGKQLIEYIGNQGPVYSPPIPKYLLPKILKKDSNTTDAKSKTGSKDMPTPLKSKPGIEMLSHLKELKEKNFNIQNNIEKAIKVIENKMADIIDHPNSEKNTNAFDVMEKEITNVLSLMKCNNQKKSRTPTPKSRTKNRNIVKCDPEADLQSISEELFRKLQHILDAERSVDSSLSNTDQEEIIIQCKPKLNIAEDKLEKLNDIEETVPVKLSTQKTMSKSYDVQKGQEGSNQNAKQVSIDVNDEPINDNEDRKLQNHGDCTELCQKLDTLIQKGEECLKESTPTKAKKPGTEKSEAVDETFLTCPDKEQDAPSFMTSVNAEIRNDTNLQETLDPKKSLEENGENTNNSFPEYLNKFIKRVEDIYKELDEIQSNSSEENVDNIPTFKDIPPMLQIESREFLTPFMQAVKDKRKNSDSPRSSNLTKSPSYYNVLNFLENLNDIQQEEVKEVHTARLCYSAIVSHIPHVFHQQKIEHTLSLELSRPSCLKKSSDECKFKPKKVSFSVVKEDKHIQADICPFHKIKHHKISNHQFPPLSVHTTDSEPTLENPDKSNEYYTTEDCYDKTKAANINENLELCQMDCQGDQEHVISKLEDISKIYDHSLSPDEASDSIYESSSMQFSTEDESQIQVFYDSTTETVPKVVVKSKVCEGDYSSNAILQVKDSLHRGFKKKPKIVIFREISNVSDMLKPIKNLEMLFGKSNPSKIKYKQNSMEVEKKSTIDNKNKVKKNEVNVLFLQSVYAAMYLLIFAVLNIEHTIECIY